MINSRFAIVCLILWTLTNSVICHEKLLSSDCTGPISNVYSLLGATAELPCHVFAGNVSDISWIRQTGFATSNDFLNVSDAFALSVISNITGALVTAVTQSDHEGIYICLRCGRDQCSVVKLTVLNCNGNSNRNPCSHGSCDLNRTLMVERVQCRCASQYMGELCEEELPAILFDIGQRGLVFVLPAVIVLGLVVVLIFGYQLSLSNRNTKRFDKYSNKVKLTDVAVEKDKDMLMADVPNAA